MEERRIVNTSRAIDIGESLLFWASNYNGLFEMEKNSGEVKYITGLPEEDFFKTGLFSALVKVEDNIVLASETGKIKIAVYNYKTKDWRVNELNDIPLGEKYSESLVGFCDCISYNNYVYIIGHMLPLIIQLDLETLEVKYITEWMKQIDISSLPEKIESNYRNALGLQKNYIPNIFFTKGGIKEHMAYFPMRCGRWVLELNMDTAQSRIIDIPSCAEVFNEGNIIGDELWLMGCYQHVIVIYNLITHSINEISLTGNTQPTETKNALYYQPIEFEEKVMILPLTAENAYWVDKKTKEFTVCEEWGTNNTAKSRKKIIMNKAEKIYYISSADDTLKEFDISCGSEKVFEMKFEEAYKIGKRKSMFRQPIIENKENTLKEYIEIINSLTDELL